MKNGHKKASQKVPFMLDWLGARAAGGGKGWLLRLAQFETAMVADDIADRPIVSPVFICGLARAGSTLLLEMIAGADGFVSHRYRDYPFVMTPIFWNTILKFWKGTGGDAKSERSHQDRIMINANSPEAFDEMIWMNFVDNLHDPQQSNVQECASKPFADFYRAHIQKLLWLRLCKRFVSKNNYNTARIGALAGMFPNAIFVVPVREPVTHVASLVRQHAIFSKVQADDPRALSYMQRCGHFEFGLDFRPVNFGDDAVTADIRARFAAGDIARGYAIYWRDTYGYILKQLETHKDKMIVMPYEQLCAAPATELQRLSSAIKATVTPAKDISLPDYYQHSLSHADIAFIQSECADVYERILKAV